jgi:iron complex outermembrane receptor protein
MNFSRLFPSLLALCTTVSVVAQTPPPDPTSEDPVHLENVVVTATPYSRNQADLTSATTVLTGRALQVRRQGTLGETLAGEVGMASTSFGPGAGRPIIRGLGGDRIRVLENGVGTLDASVTSPDHAVSVEPFLVERIEVVRGPASLLYGSAAVGGVVNVITHRIETELPEAAVSGRVEARHHTGSNETGYGGVTDVAVHRSATSALVVHLDGFRRKAKDLEIPGFAESAALRAEEAAEAAAAGEPAPEETAGVLANTAVESEGGAAGLSWVSRRLNFGVSYNGFNTLYGVPGGAHAHEHEGEEGAEAEEEEAPVRIDLRQRRIDAQGEARIDGGFVQTLRFKAGRAEYRHQELEGDEIGTTFENRGYDARFELLHQPLGAFEGAWGLQGTRSDFSAVGEEAFLPASVTDGRALFVFEEAKQGALTWQAGARYEDQEIELKDGSARRRDRSISASAGLVWTWAEPYTLALSVTRTERAPNAQELFANGPHIGTGAFEIGDATLGTETSTGVELGVRRRSGAVTGSASVYVNSFSGYIFEQPSGEEEDGLPVYRYGQRDADFWGAELEAIIHLHEGSQHRLDLRVAGDFTRAEESSGAALPRIPPFKGTVGLTWSAGGFAAGMDVQRVARQSRVAAEESATDGYTLISAYGTYRVLTGGLTYDLFLRATNLGDEEARLHTSFLKDVAPLGGRAFSAGVQLAF